MRPFPPSPSRWRRSSVAAVVVVATAGCVEPESGNGGAVSPRVEAVSAEPERDAEAERARAEAERAHDEAERARLESEARARAESDARAREEAERLAFEQRYPLHGTAFHFLARVFAEPSDRAVVIGYMRRGAHFRASARVPGRGCARGWHEVPGPGFVCRGDGYLVGEGVQTFEPSPNPPALEDALPYAYAYTPRRSTPQFFRIPTVDEVTRTTALFARMEAAEATAAATSDENPVEAPPPPGSGGDVEETPPAEDADAGMPDFLRMRMQKGFYVSVDGEENADDGRRFVRTVRGAYVPADALIANNPPTHRGVILGGEWQLPIGFVYRSGTHRLLRDPVTGAFTDAGLVDQHTPFVFHERITRGSSAHLVTSEGWIVRENTARIARPVARPNGVPPEARWIHVDLSEQVLVAYEGDRPVFATTVSTGREGFASPTGTFRIQSKHVSTTMDDLAAGPEAYSIEDVPWTMYFEGNFALHGAFWHNQFGRVRSHGCINLAPADARWLFQWSTPTLPASWHGVFSRRGDMGTYVVIEP